MTVSLSEVAEINPKSSLPSTLPRDSVFDFLPMADVSENGFVSVSAQRPFAEVQKGFTTFHRGDILIAKITPCFENNKIAIADISTEIGFGSTEFHVVRCDKTKLNSRYLLHLLRSEGVRAEGKKRMTGSGGQQRVPKQFLEELTIPLPPLEEQTRIAAILDQADELRRKRQRVIDRMNDLRQAIFHEMFGDPISNNKNLESVPLGDLIRVSSGTGLTAENQNGGPYPVFGGNGVNGWHDEFTVSAGTIVIGRVGVYCGAVHITETEAWVTDNALIVTKKNENLNTTYLRAALFQANLNQYAGRSAQPLVSGSRIYPVRILLPDFPAQEQFERRISGMELIGADLASHQVRLNALFSALQGRAFLGEL